MQTSQEKETIKVFGYQVQVSQIDNPQLRKAIRHRLVYESRAQRGYHTDEHIDTYEDNYWGKEVHSDYHADRYDDYDDSN